MYNLTYIYAVGLDKLVGVWSAKGMNLNGMNYFKIAWLRLDELLPRPMDLNGKETKSRD
jgi:hypothetical protein